MNDIPINERLILALDVDEVSEARKIIADLGDEVQFYKLGFQLLMGGDYFNLVSELKDRGKRVFVDLKLFDIPRTVAAAIRCLNRWEVDFATVHGDDEIMQAASESADSVKILAVTALTSMEKTSMQEFVLERAGRALKFGCSGVICSGLEVAYLRKNLDSRLMIVTPGIRPTSSAIAKDDQKRVVTPTEAFAAGADHIVVGRPILASQNKKTTAMAIQSEIAKFFAS